MRASTIEERFWQWVAEPTEEGFWAVREEVLAGVFAKRAPASGRQRSADVADPESRLDYWAELHQLFDQRRYQHLYLRCSDLFALTCLSPRLHFWMGVAAIETRQAALSQQHRTAMQALLRALIDSGDGTREEPFVVTYVSDEYDILRALGLQAVSQRMLERSDGRYDVIGADDGQPYWFDVSRVVPAGPAAGRSTKSLHSARTGD